MIQFPMMRVGLDSSEMDPKWLMSQYTVTMMIGDGVVLVPVSLARRFEIAETSRCHDYDLAFCFQHRQSLIKIHLTALRGKKTRKMAQQYVSSVPSDGSLKPGIASFFESFYAVSDIAVAHEQYADHFTSDAKLIMASKETSGRDGK
jgi:hypothetical protein